MQALGFRAGPHRFAVRMPAVLKVLPRAKLRMAPFAPPEVLGLLAFRGAMVPVVDLCQLVLGRPCAPTRATRMIVIAAAGGRRCFALQAEEVLDTVSVERTLTGLHLPDNRWLGELLGEGDEDPQLIEPDHLLPDALAALFEPAAGQ